MRKGGSRSARIRTRCCGNQLSLLCKFTTMRDLREADPLRDGITEDTIVFNDLVDIIAQASNDLARYEQTGESPFATELARVLNDVSVKALLFRKRIVAMRKRDNEIEAKARAMRWEAQKELRRERGWRI